MGGLSAQRILQVWERGLERDVHARTLLLLAASHPEETGERLAALPLGARDADLVDLRCRTLGPELEGRTLCPRCGAQLRFRLDGPTLFPPPASRESTEAACSVEGIEISYRLPDSADLAAAGACTDVPSARLLLLRRCVLRCRREDRDLPVEELPEPAVAALGEAMLERDPGAEMRVDLSCAVCGQDWWVLLEIGDFLWREIEALARRLIDEVGRLARAYGWAEAEILAMGSARRKLYLESIPK